MEFSFRPLKQADLPLLVTWLAKPHVNRWWKDPVATLEAVKQEYDGCIDGTEPTDVYLTVIEGEPIGLIQSYWVKDYPEHAKSVQLDKAVGVDVFIGEENLIGKGYGPALLTQFIARIIRSNYKDVDYVVADPEVANLASIRALEKAGFQKGRVVAGEYGPEQLMVARL